jgi:adenine phosphoribosyltransferase
MTSGLQVSGTGPEPADAPAGEAAALVRDLVREIRDFPTPGVTFKDITPVLGDGRAFVAVIDAMADALAAAEVQRVVGIEARGFIVAAPVAYRLGVPFVPVRRAGRLPWAVAREEYGRSDDDVLEMHRDAIRPGERVAVVDDVLATGGTAAAVIRLVEGLGAHVVGVSVLLELTGQRGRDRLGDRPVAAVLAVD